MRVIPALFAAGSVYTTCLLALELGGGAFAEICAIFSAALIAGLLALPQRQVFLTRWFLCGVLTAVVIALPSFLWQAQHGYPMWTLLRNAEVYKNAPLSPLQYLVSSHTSLTHGAGHLRTVSPSRSVAVSRHR
jgi:hypothetical protein